MEHDPRIARARLRMFAQVSGAFGLLAVVFLTVYYSLGEPFPPGENEWSWNGLAGNLAGATALGALVPLACALWLLLPDNRTVWVWTVLGASAMALLALCCVLLALHLIDFQVQAVAFTTCIAFVFGWQRIVSRHAASGQSHESAVWRWGAGLGVTGLAAGLVIALALLLPWGSGPQLVVLTIGWVPSIVSTLALPAWTLALARLSFPERVAATPGRRAAAV